MTRGYVIGVAIALIFLALAFVLPAFIAPGTTSTYQLGHAPTQYASTSDTVPREWVPYVSTTSTTTTAPRSRHRGNPAGDVNGHPCGGDLPPCWVLRRESGGDPTAFNPTGCYEGPGRVGCRGKWQCSTSTCDGTGSEAEQDAEARRIWNGGRGCSHWNACGAAA